ncbi:uncharacterized protein [Diadema antillarum]|uniref:uncharacterized protein n=1 Tax=Diadema antillarum TaxID=105358 RepID=UPI003A8BD29D
MHPFAMPSIPLHKMPVYAPASGRSRHQRFRFLPRRMWRLRRLVHSHWRALVVTALTISTVYFVFAIRKKALTSSRTKYANLQAFQMLFGAPEDEFEKEFRDKSRLPPCVETMEETPRFHTGDPLLSYFLSMYVDGMEVTWSSDVNSKSSLFQALQDYMLMMVEAEVRVFWSDPKTRKNGTAMITPSATKSDEDGLPLQRYLYYVARYSNKGVQLNFPDVESVNVALPILKDMRTQLHAPVWLHADILPGPNRADFPIDPVQFVTAVQNNFVTSTLSLGWATDWSPDAPQIRYSWFNVIEMAKICAGIRQPVTFAIRAVYALRSMRQLRFLLSLASRFTVTVWMDKYDIMPLPDLGNFRRNMDPKRIFYNLPNNFMESIKNVNGQQPPPLDSDGVQWNRNLWQPVLMDDVSLVFLGADQVVLEGTGSWIVSKVPYQAEMQSKGRMVVVEGKLQFLNRDPTAVAKKEAARIIIRSSGVNPPEPSMVQGVQLVVRPDGFIELSEINMKHAHMFDVRTSAHLPQSDCYNFKLVDKGEDYPIYCEVKMVKCESDEADVEPLLVSLHFKAPYEPQTQMFYVVVNAAGGKQALVVENLVVYS